jgi:hypothetical protein
MPAPTKPPTLFTETRRQAAEDLRLRQLQGEAIPRDELIAFLLDSEKDIAKAIVAKNGPATDVDFF